MKGYFSHDIDARNDLKMIRLRKRHGLAGIGAFWCICERLCAADDYRIGTDYEGIALELDCDESLIKSVVEDFGLFIVDGGQFWSRSMCKRMAIKDEKAKALSEAGKRGAQKRWGNNGEAMATLIAPNSPLIAPNSNKIKENKIKEEGRNEAHVRAREDDFSFGFETESADAMFTRLQTLGFTEENAKEFYRMSNYGEPSSPAWGLLEMVEAKNISQECAVEALRDDVRAGNIHCPTRLKMEVCEALLPLLTPAERRMVDAYMIDQPHVKTISDAIKESKKSSIKFPAKFILSKINQK